MEYTKCEIIDMKDRIEHELKIMSDYLPTRDDNWLPGHMVIQSLHALKEDLKPMREYVINNDDYPLAVEIVNMIIPVWNKYCDSAQNDESLQCNLAYEVEYYYKKMLNWVRDYEAKHLKKPIAPANNPSAKDFLIAFNALSRDCLMYIENKYDLGYKENRNAKTVLSPYMQHKIYEELPRQIASGFNEGIITLANLNRVIEEIETNIDNCKTQPELERYVVKLLEPFRALSEHTTAIYQHKDFEKQREAIVSEMMKLGTVENCLHDLLYIMTKYANKLYAVLIQRGFNLGEFQDDVEIYLKKNWTWLDIAPYVGGRKRAQRFMGQQKTPTANPSTNDSGEEKTATTAAVDRGKMKNLFNESFLNIEFRPKDSVINDDKKTLFVEFCNRIDTILSSNDKKPRNNKNLGSIAYMIYCSKFAKPKYRKIEGKKGGFSILIKTFFDIVSLPAPKYTHPTYYDKPSEEITSYFGELLKWDK